MRLRALILVLILIVYTSIPVFGLGEGAYEFETDPAFTYVGTWSTSTLSGMVVRTATINGSQMYFTATGSSLVIYRLMRTGVASTMDVCVAGVCQSVSNATSGSFDFVYPIIFAMPPGNVSVIITKTGGTVINLDYVVILNEASAPTSVPTATIVPSSTPAPTATPASTTTPQPTPTPQPTSTPAPTATPYTLSGAIIAIDPSRRYEMMDGQITSVEYGASAGDIHLGNLLTTLLFSVWGFFMFCVLVLVRYKKK